VYGVEIKGIRKRLKLSQAEFAEILNVSQPYLSEIELNKRPVSELVTENLKRYIDANKIQIDLSEPVVPYLQAEKKTYDEIESFRHCDMIYRVTDINAVGEYKTGYILAMKEIHRKELAPIGLPYLIQTKTDRLELMRYIMAIDTEKGMVQLAMDLQGKFAQLFPLSEIDHIFTVISFMGQKM
jgi:transcriptional regulator with XRE-family HTH domain